MFCTQCGKDNIDSNRFCIECGAPLKKPSEINDNSDLEQQPKHINEEDSSWQDVSDGTTVISEVSTLQEEKKGSDLPTTILKESSIILVDDVDCTEYKLEDLPKTIGKGSAADCILPGDETISRVHAKIHVHNGEKFVIEDMNSTNKTYLNGNVLEPEELVVLQNGDKIKLGGSKFTVKY